MREENVAAVPPASAKLRVRCVIDLSLQSLLAEVSGKLTVEVPYLDVF